MLGGGLPVGSVILLVNENEHDEDGQVDYTKLLHKYFLSEGVAEGNGVFHASCGHLGSEAFLSALPDFEDADHARDEAAAPAQAKEDNLQIAWRYKQQQQGVSVRDGGGAGRKFNLNKAVSRERMDKVEHHEWTPPESESELEGCGDHYRQLFGRLKEVLSQPKYSSSPQASQIICLLKKHLLLYTTVNLF